MGSETKSFNPMSLPRTRSVTIHEACETWLRSVTVEVQSIQHEASHTYAPFPTVFATIFCMFSSFTWAAFCFGILFGFSESSVPRAKAPGRLGNGLNEERPCKWHVINGLVACKPQSLPPGSGGFVLAPFIFPSSGFFELLQFVRAVTSRQKCLALSQYYSRSSYRITS